MNGKTICEKHGYDGAYGQHPPTAKDCKVCLKIYEQESSRDPIYRVRPADNVKLAEMELTVERAWKKKTNDKQAIMLTDIQSLIERVKLDDKKIRKLEKMNGISWLGDEGKEGEKGAPLVGKQDLRLLKKKRTAATLYEDRSRWAIPINCADGGFKQQAYWQGREDGAREMEEEIHGE